MLSTNAAALDPFLDDARRLCDIPGFGPKRVDLIREDFPDELDDPRLRANPYLLSRLDGIGFLLADRVALAIGVAPDSPLRVEAATEHALRARENIGHTAVPGPELADDVSKLLGVDKLRPPARSAAITRTADGLWSRTRTLRTEHVVADAVRKMLHRAPSYDLHFVDDYLMDDQRQALEMISSHCISVMCGGPGTGKTHAIKAIVQRDDGGAIALCAPTGKASKRLEELTDRPAQTIHRLLGAAGKNAEDYDQLPAAHSHGFRFRHNRSNPLPHRLVVVDEVSMVDVCLMADLCDALGVDAQLLLVGDPFQLPSVGPGSVLRDVIAGGVPAFELFTLKRQDPKLMIARNCQAIRYEKNIHLDHNEASDFFFFPCNDAAKIRDLTVELVTQWLPREGVDPRRDAIVLAPLKRYGELRTPRLNEALRAKLNPEYAQFPDHAPGDRVIQDSNDYDLGVMNGELGTVLELRPDGTVVVCFDTPQRLVEIPRGRADLLPAWALTIHKAQGSEWPWVVVPLHEEQCGYAPIANAQLLYTAISRARRGCLVIGSAKAAKHLAATHWPSKRQTRLAGML
jgi:exodeoxyribonuclease V alpha subunit